MMVVRHLLALIILSLLFIIGMRYAHQGGEWLVHVHDWITTQLRDLFTVGRTGNISRELIAVLAIPLLAGLIPAIIFFIMQRRWSPVFMAIVWIVWALQIGVLAMTAAAANMDMLSPNATTEPPTQTPPTPAH